MSGATEGSTPTRTEGLQEALALLEGLGQSLGPTSWISGLEVRLRGTDGPLVRTVIEREGFGRETLDAALLIKRVSAQIDVLVHAIGILNALPYILEPVEVVESLSLGAGNTGRAATLRPIDESQSSSSSSGAADPSPFARTGSSRTSSTWSATPRPSAGSCTSSARNTRCGSCRTTAR